MVTVFCALYCEAEGIIDHYQLHKDNSNPRFQVFEDLNRTIRVVITGVGGIAAAAAVGSTAERYSIGKEDMLLNFGVCAGTDDACEGLYLCSKLMELPTGRTFYPDMLYRHAFGEAALVTGSRIWTDNGQEKNPMEAAHAVRPETLANVPRKNQTMLYDMEAAAIYQAASYYVGPHRMQFLKLVSDHGIDPKINSTTRPNETNICSIADNRTSISDTDKTKQPLSPHTIRKLIQPHDEEIISYIDRMIALMVQETENIKFVSEKDNPWFEKLCVDLHCSKVMGDELRQQLYYQELSGNNYEEILQGLYAEGMLPCKDKREGKKCLEELKRRLL